MRAYFWILIAAISASSCAGRGVGEAKSRAEAFVASYFAADYDRAASLCGEELQAKVMESASQIGSLPDTLRSAFLELSEELQIHTGEVYELSRDSVMVDFDILVPEEMESLRNTLLVVRDAGGEWWVMEIR